MGRANNPGRPLARFAFCRSTVEKQTCGCGFAGSINKGSAAEAGGAMSWSYAIIALLFIAGAILAFPLAIGVVLALAGVLRGLGWFTARCPGLSHLRRWHRRRVYRPGLVVSRFVAPDVRRDVLVVDAPRLDAGVIAARVRTWNVLYAARGLAPAAPFGEVQVVELAELWAWFGAAWGGPVPQPAGAAQDAEPGTAPDGGGT
jgi:hypothetical protein